MTREKLEALIETAGQATPRIAESWPAFMDMYAQCKPERIAALARVALAVREHRDATQPETAARTAKQVDLALAALEAVP